MVSELNEAASRTASQTITTAASGVRVIWACCPLMPKEIWLNAISIARINPLLLQGGCDPGGVVATQQRLQPDVGDLRALPRGVVVLLNPAGREHDADVHLLLCRRLRVGDALELQPCGLEQDAEAGRNVT